VLPGRVLGGAGCQNVPVRLAARLLVARRANGSQEVWPQGCCFRRRPGQR